MGVMRLNLVMKSIVLIVMARVLGIYDLIIAAIISAGINPKAKPKPYFLDGYAHLSFKLACSLARLAAGMAISIVRDTRVSLKMKSQLLKAEMKSLMKEQRQKVQYHYYRDYEGDQLTASKL
uniref:V-type proton ATPase proteolipid subunit n=1 Tax=Zea mays TaxID=4577 RepID=A0A804NZ08_MAIZE